MSASGKAYTARVKANDYFHLWQMLDGVQHEREELRAQGVAPARIEALYGTEFAAIAEAFLKRFAEQDMRYLNSLRSWDRVNARLSTIRKSAGRAFSESFDSRMWESDAQEVVVRLWPQIEQFNLYSSSALGIRVTRSIWCAHYLMAHIDELDATTQTLAHEHMVWVYEHIWDPK